MKNSTGLTPIQFTRLFDRVKDAVTVREIPCVLGLRRALTAVCTYLRTNRTQAEIAEQFGVSQSNISRAVSTLTPVLVTALADLVPTREEIPTGTAHLLDGPSCPAGPGETAPSCTPGSTTPPASTSRS